MKTMLVTLLLISALPLAAAAGPVDTAFNYQGYLESEGQPVTGLVDLQFYLWDSETLGILQGTGRQFQAVQVTDGVFSVSLDWGAGVFDGNERWLDIRVRNPHDGSQSTSFQTLTPRQPISAVPYALHALNGAGGGSGLWTGVGDAITNTNSGFVGIGRTDPVTSAELFGIESAGVGFGGMYIRSQDSNTGKPFYGYSTPSYTAYNYLDESNGTWYFYNGNYMYFTRAGYLGLGVQSPGSRLTAAGVIESTTGGFKFPDGSVQTTASDGGGSGSSEAVTLTDVGGNQTVELWASTNGAATTDGPVLRMFNTTGQRTFYLFGGNTAAADLSMYNTSNFRTVRLMSNYASGEGAFFELKQGDGGNGIRMQAHGFTGAADRGGEIELYTAAGRQSITLHGDYQNTGDSRIAVDVLEITGGSDLSEKFDVAAAMQAVEPGAVVCIDPASPGDLRVSESAYDTKVAGIVSGADGIKPGLLMGQRGSEADGGHPVALTGRVYCKVDASFGAIAPGDLLTTSPTPGHAMKVSDHGKALGAILGKAMTSLEAGQGMVLVLVSLQ